MKKFATLATGAVVVSTIVPAFAATDGSTTEVDVNELAITIVGGDFDFAAGDPTDPMTASAEVTVTTNNDLGYQVDLSLTDLEKVGVRVAADRIEADDIDVLSSVYSAKVENADDANEAAGYTPTSGLAAGAKIADSGIRSLEAGDVFDVELGFTMPWVEDGTYAGTATFTATNLELE